MKILFLNATGQLGGAERVLICLLEELRKARPSWTLEVLAGDEGPLIQRLKKLRFDVAVLPMPENLSILGESASRSPLALLRGLFAGIQYRNQMQREIITRKPDIVHTLNFKMHVLAAVCRRHKGSKLLWHIHDFVSSRRLTKTLLRLLSNRPQGVVAISESVGIDIRALFRTPEKVRTILNAIDITHFSPAGPREQLGDGTHVGLIATFARWKGHEVFLRAVASLKCHVHAYVVGGSLYKTAGSQYTLAEIRQRAEELGVGDQVTFTGFLDDTAALIRALDIVVHASTEPEPFGLVIAEGMACGRAVIASMAGGASEILQPGITGLGHTPGDFEGLASAIDLLVENPELRKRYGDAARRMAEKLFNPARMASQMIDVYEAI